MKKLYTLFLPALFLTTAINGQLVLTQAVYSPTLGDVSSRYGYDSTGVLPMQGGSNQTWNFNNTLVWNNSTAGSTFTTMASAPNGTCCSNANLAEKTGNVSYNYWQSTTPAFELWGVTTSTISLTFTNSAIVASWPLSDTYNNTDLFSGTAKTGTMNGTCTGTMTGVGLGTGTVVLPSGITFTNCLHTKVIQKAILSFSSGFITATITITNHQFYGEGVKFPLINVEYYDFKSNFLGNNTDVNIMVNGAFYTGINEYNAGLNSPIFPNPAKDKITVALENTHGQEARIDVMNSMGQLVKSESLGSDKGSINTNIDISSLQSGIYFVKTIMGDKISTKKLVIE